ncbi:MAG: hypothetical protein H6895_04910 [Defluviimonas sp.]|uniref:hypothetical protein n=1 Tax=Albidovulum sp. TaxID=1872424 RepID=UPI002A2928B9|nr:hypothetical protein [Defluviimonas sp.]
MAVVRDIHSELVRRLKILLPLLALAILSTLFLLSRQPHTADNLAATDAQIGDLVRDPRMTMPEYSGLTDDGAALRLDASSARPGPTPDAPATAEEMTVRIDTPNGLGIDVTAKGGLVDRATGRLHLTDGVVVLLSSGYRLVSDALDAALDRTELLSEGPVSVDAPFGKIDAGRMKISHTDAGVPGYLLNLSNKVRLIYQPPEKDQP